MGRGLDWVLLPLLPVSAHLSAVYGDALILLFGILLGVTFRGGKSALFALAGLSLILFGWWGGLHWSAPVALIVPVAIFLTLAWLFGSTLKPGSEPLVTLMARTMGDEMDPATCRYTRYVTLAWTLFLTTLALISAALALWAPITLWSLFTNLISYLLVALFFIGEFYIRPRFVHQPRQTLRQFVHRLLLVRPRLRERR